MIKLKNFGTITDEAIRAASGNLQKMEMPVDYFDLNEAGRIAISDAIFREDNGGIPYIGKGEMHIVLRYERECNVCDNLKLFIEQKQKPCSIGKTYYCNITLSEQERKYVKREIIVPFVEKYKEHHRKMREEIILDMPTLGKITEESIETICCDFSDTGSDESIIFMNVHPECLEDWYRTLAFSHIKSDMETVLEEDIELDIETEDYIVLMEVRINEENMTAEMALYIEDPIVGEFIEEIPVTLTDDEWSDFLNEIILMYTDYAVHLGTRKARRIKFEQIRDNSGEQDAVNY